MFKDLTVLSQCGTPSNPTMTMTFAELEQEYVARGCDVAPDAETDASGCRPAGFVFHESRCGSTLAANLLMVAQQSLVYSEPPLEQQIIELQRQGMISEEQMLRAVRVMVAAQGRVIWGANFGGVPNPVPGADPSWTPRYLFVKQRSSLTPRLAVFRAAFPAVPWAFIHRDASEVLASLMRNAVPIPASADGTRPESADTNLREVRTAPCMRDRGTLRASPFVVTLTGQRSWEGTAQVDTETFCAVAVAELCAVALQQAGEARKEGLARLRASAPDVPENVVEQLRAAPLDGAALGAAIAGTPGLGAALEAKDGALFLRSTGKSVLGGIGQPVFIDYHAGEGGSSGSSGGRGGAEGDAYPAALLRVFSRHFSPLSGGAPWLSEADLAGMLAESKRYSKSRGNAGSVPPEKRTRRGLPPHAGVDATGLFVPDSEAKQGRAWPALKAAGAKFIAPLQAQMLGFNVGAQPVPSGSAGAVTPPPEGGAVAAMLRSPRAATVALGSHAFAGGADGYAGGGTRDPDFDVRLLPIGAGYPALYPLKHILQDWNPDIATIPLHYGKYASLRVLDYGSAGDLAEAEHYRAAELPFILRNVAGQFPALSTWTDDEYLKSRMGNAAEYAAEVNDNAHFMYGNKGRKKAAAPEKQLAHPAPKEAHMSMEDWLGKAHATAAAILGEERAPGALPPGWAAPPYFQSPVRMGLNNVSDDGGVGAPAVPSSGADALSAVVAAAAGGVGTSHRAREERRALRRAIRRRLTGTGAQLPQLPHTLEDGTTSSLYGRTIRERLAARGEPAPGVPAGEGLATAAPDVAPVPPSTLLAGREKRLLYYLRASAGARGLKDDTWIPADLPMYNTGASAHSKFFLVDPKQQRGIHCRFGMPNIIAESHYDSGRNFIAMIRGRKRYILSPPSECPKLDMLKSGPSARHSASDWTSPEGIATVGGARALEVILEPGDVLYVPSFWFHFIVSLSVNIQCNTRSGTPPQGLAEVMECGLNAQASEDAGVHTSVRPPPAPRRGCCRWERRVGPGDRRVQPVHGDRRARQPAADAPAVHAEGE